MMGGLVSYHILSAPVGNKVLTTQVSVTISRHTFKCSIINGQPRHLQSFSEVSRNIDSCMVHLLTKIGLSGLLHFDKLHCIDLFRGKGLYDFERIKLDVILPCLVRPVSTDHSLGIKHSVLCVGK